MSREGSSNGRREVPRDHRRRRAGAFHVPSRTPENAMTLEELQRHGINPQSVTESLTNSTKGWLSEDAGQVVAFSMADRATGRMPDHRRTSGVRGKGHRQQAHGSDQGMARGIRLHAIVAHDGSRCLASRLRLLSPTGLNRLEDQTRPAVDRDQPNQSTKSTAPLEEKFSVFATTPCRGLSLPR